MIVGGFAVKDSMIVRPYIDGGLAALRATEDDIPQVAELLLKTAGWLRSRGSDQWSGLLRGEDSHRTPEAIKQGNVYLFRDGSVLAGMLMLLPQPSPWDRELWGADGSESAVYLHRLAINRDYAGQGLGGRMLDWAGSGIRFPERDRVRLDCDEGNEALNAFYRSKGYAYAGSAVNAAGTFSKYEKPFRA